jgi:hypothetical protein
MAEMRVALSSVDPRIVARDYAPQFEAAIALRNAIWQSLPHRGGNKFEVVLMNVLGRSIGTYHALLHLLGSGFTDQASMLNRPLFEDMVFGYWIALDRNRASADELVSAHIDRVNVRFDYLVERIRRGGVEGLAEHGDPDEAWSGRASLVKSLDKRVDDIKDLWVRSGGMLDELLFHRDITHWISNLTLHTSGRSLLGVVERSRVKTTGGSLFAYGQSGRVDEMQMLYGFEFSSFRIGCLAKLVLLETGRPVDSFETAYSNLMRAVKDWAPSRRARVGRNDPCWCGSGKKLKRCHGLDNAPTSA